jgi:DNA-binding NtrC family response regulator
MGVGRILLVDDEHGARQALAEALRQVGLEVLSASDAFEALKLTDGQAPDLTITELMMPGMNGIDLLKALRQRDPEAQVLLISGFREVETAVEANARRRPPLPLQANRHRQLSEELRPIERPPGEGSRRRRSGNPRCAFVARQRSRASKCHREGGRALQRRGRRDAAPAARAARCPAPFPLRIPGASMEELERHAILSTLQANGGSTGRTAATLGISVRKIQYRLQQYAKSTRSGLPSVRPSSVA